MGYWLDLKEWLLKDPGKLLRHFVLFACLIVVIVQLTECFMKLRFPPISTHSYYRLNDTIEMPAVTICRDPPYKQDVLSDISNSMCSHPKYATCWRNYPYDEVKLNEFFLNASYDKEETFMQVGLNGEPGNVKISSSIHFNMGLCHTLRPQQPLKRANRNSGYSMMLKHHIYTENETANNFYENDPGWHIFLHDYRENFTEINMKGSGRVEYIFAELNEEIEIKLEGQYFSIVETSELSCEKTRGYSDLNCGEVCIWDQLTRKSNCSGPWMTQDELQLPPPCNNYADMKNLTTEYGIVYNSDDDDFGCNCIIPCETRLYSTYIQNRKVFTQPEGAFTQVWIYYTTKIVSMIEERPSYDSTQFIADIGGSLGFLLGLSVLGIIGMLEYLTLFCCGGLMKRMQHKEEKQQKEPEDKQSQSSEETLDVATIYERNL